MQLSRQQVQTILNNAPLGADKKKILDGLIMRGYELEGVDTNAVKQKLAPQVQPKEEGSITSAFKSGINKIKEGQAQGQNASNPLELLEGGAKIAAGAVDTVSAPLAPVFKPVGKAINFLGDKLADAYGEDVQRGLAEGGTTTAERVLEDVANVSTVAGAVAGVKGANAVAKTAKNVASEAGSKVLTSADNVLTKASKVTEKTPAKIMQRVARIPKAKQAKFEATAGESVGEYLTNRNIFGNIDEISTKLYERFSKSKNTADEALASLKGTFEPAPVKTMLEDLLARETRISTPGAPSPILSRVQELSQKAGREGWTMSEINEIKRMFERNNTVDYLRQNLPESVAKAKNLDSAVREWQFKQADNLGLKNLKEINRETRLAKQLLDDIGKEYAGSAGNNAFSLTDYVLLAGGDVTALSSFLVKSGLSSKKIQSAIAKYLNKGKETLGEVKADLGTSQVKQLPAPKAGSPKKQINVPIRQPSRKAIQQGTEIVKKKKK